MLGAPRGKAQKCALKQAVRRSGAGREEAEGARIAMASPATRPEIAVAIAMGAPRARVLLYSPTFILYCLFLFVLL